MLERKLCLTIFFSKFQLCRSTFISEFNYFVYSQISSTKNSDKNRFFNLFYVNRATFLFAMVTKRRIFF